jgi:hypothetical protein
LDTADVRARLSRSIGIVVVALIAAACASRGGPIARSVSTLPPSLGSCHERNVGPAFQACYDELAEYLRLRAIALADGDPVAQIHVVDAFGSIVKDLVPRFGGGFSLDTQTGDRDVVWRSAEPLRTTWSLGGDPVVVWACFAGGTVTVGRDPCPGDPVTSAG